MKRKDIISFFAIILYYAFVVVALNVTSTNWRTTQTEVTQGSMVIENQCTLEQQLILMYQEQETSRYQSCSKVEC